MISLKEYITASGKYPEREQNKELTAQYLDNAAKLLNDVNNLLTELGIASVTISSGFRPSTVNANIPNAAKKSLHTTCMAVDMQDSNGELDKLLSTDKGQELLAKYGLWQEHPTATKGWCHLDKGERVIKNRPNCLKRQFNP